MHDLAQVREDRLGEVGGFGDVLIDARIGFSHADTSAARERPDGFCTTSGRGVSLKLAVSAGVPIVYSVPHGLEVEDAVIQIGDAAK